MSDYPLDAFLFYRSYREALNGMTQKDQLATLLAIYALYGVEPKLAGKMPTSIFTVVRPNIDANAARRRSGKKGGRPKKTNGFQECETDGFSEQKTNGFQKSESNKGLRMKDEVHRKEIAPLTPHGGKRERFAPPSVEEVAAYCLERQNGIDAEEFVSFYTSKGWRVGTSPMKDWRSAVITWEKNGPRQRTAGTPSRPRRTMTAARALCKECLWIS